MNYEIRDDNTTIIKCTCPECGASLDLTYPLNEVKKSRMQYCKKCGFEWKSRTSKPLKCPKCGSYSWDKTNNTCICSMCEHKWIARTDDAPTRCPKCKSIKWNKNIQKKKNPSEEGNNNEQNIQEKWILEKYAEDKGCFQIALETGLPYFQIMDVIREKTGQKSVRP